MGHSKVLLPLLFGCTVMVSKWGSYQCTSCHAWCHQFATTTTTTMKFGIHNMELPRKLQLNERSKVLPIRDDLPTALMHGNDLVLDSSLSIASRRTWCQNWLIAISTATAMVGTGGKPSIAVETPSSVSEVVDPLVVFGESLSSKGAGGGALNSVLPISSSSWPHNAAHPLPPLADPLLSPATPVTDVMSQQQPALEQVLQQSKLKKKINPTTHG